MRRLTKLLTKLLAFIFAIGFSQMIFADGGLVFYPFGFINPASLALVKHYKVAVGWYAAFVRNKFTGTVALPTFPPGTTNVLSGVARSSDVINIPGGQVAYRVNNRFVVGLRYSEPYNTTITFGRSGNIGRFSNNQSATRVKDISPEFAISITPKFSIGAGLDIMYIYAQANLNTFPFTVPGLFTVNEGVTKNHGSDWGLGWHVGVLGNPWMGNQIGLTYYSKTRYAMEGTSIFEGQGAGGVLVPSRSIFFDFARPGVLLFRDFQALSRQWGVFGYLYYTLWNILQTVTVKNVAVPMPPYTSNTFDINFKYRNTWRVGLGTRYAPSEDWAFIFSVNHDETPITSPVNRGLFFPETDSWGVGASIMRKVSKHVDLTLVYAHRFFRKGALDNSFGGVTTVGINRPVSDFVGLELNYAG